MMIVYVVPLFRFDGLAKKVEDAQFNVAKLPLSKSTDDVELAIVPANVGE
jgi:hypothetical protein